MSEIVLNRVDDRLIHGQVMIGWLGLRRANTVWIADDAVATRSPSIKSPRNYAI